MKVEVIKNLLEELQIKPLKSLGQNFLIDQSIIEKICTYKELDDYNQIIEIGPGLGSLTRKLELLKDKLTLIELDKSLAGYWDKEGFSVVHSDALKFDWSNIKENAILISNLPYQISSRLLIELFCLDAPFEQMILMFQKEVGDRIKAEVEDKKEYGLLSILCRLSWQVKTVTKAPNKCFYPSPEIESVVLSFERKDMSGLKNRKAFVNHLKLLFGARRKKMKGVFKKYKIDWSETDQKYLDMRPDQISAEEHLKLYYLVGESLDGKA